MPYRLDVYSHHVKVTGFDKRGKGLLLDFCRPLAEYGPVRVAVNTFVRKMLRVFAAATRNRSEFRFHIHQLNELYDFLREKAGSDAIEVHRHSPPEPVRVQFKVKEEIVLREYQPPIIDYLANDQHLNVLTLQTGKGKAQPLHANIRVPGGWTTMGEIQTGDNVIAKDGTVTTVTGTFPQGDKDIYRITFSDGRTAECCLDHLWRVYRSNYSQGWKIVDTREIKRIKNLSNDRVYVELPDPEIGEDKDFVIQPYTLGALLGDGHLGKFVLGMSSADQEVIDKIRQELPPGLDIFKKESSDFDYSVVRSVGYKSTRNPYLEYLDSAGLGRTLSHEKFIPEDYLEASFGQRLALLQGLMDTDGTAGKEGSTLFCTTSPQLAEQVVYLARSLGALARTRTKEPNHVYAGGRRKGKLAYIVQIRPRKPKELFTLARKKERVRNDNQYASTLKLRVDKVEWVSKEPAQCISVSHPEKLYVTDNFVPTHNTLMTLKAMERWGVRTLLVLKGAYIEQWIKSYCEEMEGEPKKLMNDIVVARGAKNLKALLELAADGELDKKIVIISSKTMQNFITDYERSSGESIFYDYTPDQVCELLGVGVRIVDEGHQLFHFNFRMDLYTNIQKTVVLSATLTSDDNFKDRMYRIAYPPQLRFQGAEYHKYIEVKALMYSLDDRNGKEIRWTSRGRKTYSHMEFEKSIYRKQSVLDNYLDMICDVVESEFIKPRAQGQKMLIFCSIKKFCAVVRDRIAQEYTDFDVRTFVDEDPESNLDEADIIVSTLGSAGTAKDIPDLYVTLMTTAVGAREANEQALGRLREMKNYPDYTPKFLYLVCEDIGKHVDYHRKKQEYFKDKVLSHKDLVLPYRI